MSEQDIILVEFTGGASKPPARTHGRRGFAADFYRRIAICSREIARDMGVHTALRIGTLRQRSGTRTNGATT